MRRAKELLESPNCNSGTSGQFFPIPATYTDNMESTVESCRELFVKLDEAFSPVEKLECLLKAIKVILDCVSKNRSFMLYAYCECRRKQNFAHSNNFLFIDKLIHALINFFEMPGFLYLTQTK